MAVKPTTEVTYSLSADEVEQLIVDTLYERYVKPLGIKDCELHDIDRLDDGSMVVSISFDTPKGWL